MSRKIVRVLGKRGRITIPYEIRVRNKIGYNDILSFEERDKNTIIVRKEKLCGGCTPECFDEENSIPIEDFIDSLRRSDCSLLLSEYKNVLMNLICHKAKWVSIRV